ncbi:MAG: PKD domain-containing protein [Chitinophagaceae bacterium]
MKTYLLSFSVFLLFLYSCSNRNTPLNTTEDPVFHFFGTIGNDSISMQAGVNNMYMYSNYFKDTQSIFTLIGYFAPANCNTCEPYLSFELKDVDTSNSSTLSTDLVSIFANGSTFNSYSLDSVLQQKYTEQFIFLAEKQLGNFTWDFSDGAPIQTTSPTATHVFSSGGMKKVTLTHNFQGLTDSISNLIDIDDSTCRCQFNYLIDTTNNVLFLANTSPTLNAYNWLFGDANTGTGSNTSHFYNNAGIYTASLQATTPCGTRSFSKHINVMTPSMSASGNFNYTSTQIQTTSLVPRLNKSAFVITYKNNGKVYKSFKNIKGIDQSGNPIFTFLTIGLYKNNELGQKTAIITGSVDTYLYNYSNPNDSIKIKSNNIKIASAYP